MIVLAYCAIPFCLFYFVRKRRDLVFRRLFVLFGLFIFGCALTHVGNIVTIWKPWYYLDGYVKLATGFVSIATAGVLYWATPKLLRLPSPAELARTKRELAEEARKTASAENALLVRSEALATFAHDIRTPLTTVSASVELLRDQTQNPALADALQATQTSTQLIVEVINNILNMSKLEQGKVEVARRPLDLVACLEQVKTVCGHRAHDKGIAFEVAYPTDLPSDLYGDRPKLLQILTNLAANAVKFTSEGGVYLSARCLQVEPERAEVQVDVRDTGIGIDADKLETIFDSFSQENEGISQHFGGTGLGLTISRKLAQLTDGEIGVESRKGEGSTFRLRLWLPRGPGNAAEERPA
ncbi:MAG: sensor histidine kinase [Opitutales bacterium]